MSQAITDPVWTIPVNVAGYAEQQGLTSALASLLEVTLQVFPRASHRAVVVEDDPEIANDRHIVIQVDVAMTVADSLLAQRQWHEAAVQFCPTTQVCVFRLSVELLGP